MAPVGSSGPSPRQSTHLALKLDGNSRSFLLDTGCERSLIPASFVPGYNLLPKDCNVVAANGTRI